jgi:hypothetical protein
MAEWTQAADGNSATAENNHLRLRALAYTAPGSLSGVLFKAVVENKSGPDVVEDQGYTTLDAAQRAAESLATRILYSALGSA